MQSDTQIVQAARKGDQMAFRGLVEKYKRAVYGVILPKVRDFHQAQDLASETFIQAYLSLESIKEPEKVGFWLCGIARNITDKWLTRKKRDDLSLEQLLEEHPWAENEIQPLLSHGMVEKVPDEILERAQMRQLLWRCLYALPEISQEILILFYMREMKQSEIAKVLGISLTAVRNRLLDARKRLKKKMIYMVEKTIQSQPLSENFTEQVIAEAMKRGQQYLADGRWKEAREQFQRAADIQQDYAPAYQGLGMAAKGMIDAQLDNLFGKVDRQLLEETYTELARAYRLGARDTETVWTLANLYLQFERYEEYVDLLWDFAQTSSDVKEVFKAGRESIFKMGYIPDYERAVRSHQTLLEKFKGQVTPTDQLDSYISAVGAYREIGCLDDWLKQTESLAEQIGDEMLMAQRFFYIRERALVFRRLERYPDAIRTAEEFIHWVRNSEELHPHKQRFIIEMQGLMLLPAYHQLGERQKIEAVLADAGETLQRYHTEWESMIASITDESEATRQRLNSMYQRVESYPAEASIAGIREWLDRKYYTGISYAMHNLGAGCMNIGEGEAAIRLFTRVLEHAERQGKKRVNWGNVNMWLAALMLSVRKDRDASLEYLKRAAEDRRWAASGWIKRRFETDADFEPVRDDEAFLAVVNAPVVSE